MAPPAAGRFLARPLSEAQVVAWLKQGLLRSGLQGRDARDILVDNNGAYLRSPFARQLKPTGTVWIEGWRPDVVCVLDHNRCELLAAFEVKGAGDHERGVVQASRYRPGVHEAYLCIPQVAPRTLDWLRSSARETGVGVIAVSADALRVEVAPAPLRPDPSILLDTRRYLLGEGTVRALGLNKPLHYAAALVATLTAAEPIRALIAQWGLNESAAQLALRGAASLGLLSESKISLNGRLYADLLRTAGFDLAASRPLTRRRLLDQHERLAAVLRSMLLESPAVDLLIRALVAERGGPVTFRQLGERALLLDPGLARAVFGTPPTPGEEWQMRPSTRFQLKAALHDVGLVDSPLARGAAGRQFPGGYDPAADIWESRLARELSLRE